MCPACITTIVLIAANASSAGGAVALVVKKLRAESEAKDINPKTQTGGKQNGNQNGIESN